MDCSPHIRNSNIVETKFIQESSHLVELIHHLYFHVQMSFYKQRQIDLFTLSALYTIADASSDPIPMRPFSRSTFFASYTRLNEKRCSKKAIKHGSSALIDQADHSHHRKLLTCIPKLSTKVHNCDSRYSLNRTYRGVLNFQGK